MRTGSDKQQTHPSYGMVGLSRVHSNAGTYLFGSSITTHFNTIRLRIATGAATEGEMGETRYSAVQQIVEVELSAAQFAEMITTMNVADGVPCTIRWRDGYIEEPPAPRTVTERAHEDFEAKMKANAARLAQLVADVEKATEAKGLSQAARAEIRKAVGGFVTEVRSNIPYYLRWFNEAADRISAAAKAEADAWLTHAIHAAGLAHLRSLGAGTPPQPAAPALPAAPGGKREGE